MKIYGSLERAQIEPLSSDPSAGVVGRIWFNTVDALAKLDDGTLIRSLLRNDAKAIIGNSATANENIRFHRGAANVLQFVQGGDATAEGSMSANFNKLSFLFETYTDAGKPAAGNAGRIIYLSDSKIFMGDDGTVWNGLGGAGGGGGGANWYPMPGNEPIEDTENNEKIWKFTSGETQSLTLFVKVPETYIPGKQIKLYMGHYSPSAANTILISTTSYLIRANTDAMDSTTNSHASTNTALTNTVANMYRKAVIDLTDASGQINSVAVAAGDLIKVNLIRGTDTDTADIRMIPSITEVKFS